MAVASVSNHGGQPGVVTGVTTKLDLAQLHGADEPCRVVATGVSPAEVHPNRELTLGDYVVSGTWLGRVVEVSVDVDVLFDDRSVCRVTNAGDKLRVVSNKTIWNRHKNGFFAGEAVAGDASVFKDSRWLRGHWKPSHGELEGTVAKDTASAPPPAYHPNTHNLTFFCPGGKDLMWSWCVSAHCCLRSRSAAKKKHKSRRYRPHHVLWIRMAKVKRADRRLPGVKGLKAGVKWPMAVVGTCTTVDVLWQDGTRQLGVPSASLLRIPLRNEKDFFPGQRVVGKVLSPHVTIAPTVAGRVGVVKSLSYKDQTACVSWITGVPGEVVDTVTSTYDLARSPDHSFFYGDMVVSLRPRGNQESNKATNDLSWVGHIADLCDAPYIHVKWGDGTTSKVLLHEIAIIKPRSADEILKELGDWVSDDDDAFHKKAQEDMPRDGLVRGTTAMIGKVRNIIKAVIRTLGGMLHDQVEIYMLSSSMALASRPVRTAITEKIRNCSPRISDGGHCHAGEAAEDEVFHFKHFDVVQSPQDHHYLDTTDPGDGGGRKWLKRVQQEWKILETSLPDTIYVRGFEDRMDLLRAVMVGASGTPYQDGLFFFDLQLPLSYPATPPQVKYHSFGLRANPNLYPSGTVCLSLLNTTGGKGTELWSPEASSVLQVVVSIQGLVLIGQPYYNEAGYTMQIGTPEGRRNELPYCENTYLVNLHTMLHLIRRPPVGFEAFVRDHFRRRGQYVLRACEAYLQKGCPVGTLDGEALATEASRERSCSLGFRLALANIVPWLVEAFALIGTQPGN
ncbi:unnamed protein product [Urochloa decumbens]|uniref:UBC core domain-containing protein n=1 Tax=Urochloa decumbens TaxID=240449 RepID=A0ABC9GH90_9POAL